MTQTMEVGRILPRFVTPSDVHDLKVRIDPYVLAMDGVVASCPDTAPVAAGWTAFSAAWRAYFNTEESWWHCAAQMDQGEAYEQDVSRWRDMLSRYKCASAKLPPAPTPLDAPIDWSSSGSGVGSTIKIVAVAAAVFAVALGVREVMK